MLTIGVDPHKRTHSAAAVNDIGVEVGRQTRPAEQEGFGRLLSWARSLEPDGELVWVIEDCRHVSGPLERFLLDHGERVARLPPQLMAGARRGARERGKSDPIDALAVARAALQEGVSTLPTARLSGPEQDIRLLSVHRDRLLSARTRLINELRWQCHDLWPEWEIPKRVLDGTKWQMSVAQRLRDAVPSVRVRIALDEITRIQDLTYEINALEKELGDLVRQVAPQLLAERGLGVLIAAKMIGEIAGIDRFANDSKLARNSGCAPVPVSSGNTNRYRLDRGGNRHLNHAFHMLAITKMLHDPETAAYLKRQREAGKTHREAMRCLKRQLVRRVYRLLSNPDQVPQTVCLT